MMTHCEDCDHVHNPKEPYYRWMCIKFPNLDGGGFLTKNFRETQPYMKCSGINGGACPMFKPRENGQTKLRLEDKK